MKSVVSILIFFLFSISALAGDQPPNDFLKKNISCDYVCLAFSVEDFLRYGIKPGAKINWEKDNTNWLMKVSVYDKVSSTTTVINILFSGNAATANVNRVNINGEEMRTGMIPSFITPIGEEVYRKTGREKLLVAEIPTINDNSGPADSSASPAKKEKSAKNKAKATPKADSKLQQQEAVNADRLAKAKELGDAIKSAVGTYKNSMPEVGDEFSFYMDEGKMFASYKNQKCEFKDKELNFPTILGANGLETKLNDLECELSFRFSTLSSGVKAVSVDEGGACKKFCSYSDGRSLAGRFHK
ncbi:hypothetical protein K2P97_00285 [bacterium]|nr:hypothetical protein [bacterium]